jgi:hypothetical protein
MTTSLGTFRHSFKTRPGHRPGQVIGSRVRWVDPGQTGSTQKKKNWKNHIVSLTNKLNTIIFLQFLCCHYQLPLPFTDGEKIMATVIKYIHREVERAFSFVLQGNWQSIQI